MKETIKLKKGMSNGRIKYPFRKTNAKALTVTSQIMYTKNTDQATGNVDLAIDFIGREV